MHRLKQLMPTLCYLRLLVICSPSREALFVRKGGDERAALELITTDVSSYSRYAYDQ